ncbi:MAG: collagen-like protein [Bacilli bacterium]|nr:collagen-like protein [Methanobrevibacter sp.]MBR1748272.1 collagen-like protein [Bacilli bacterium]
MPCTVIGYIKGVKGDTGQKGDKGDKGDRGEQGPQGPAGKNGVDGTTDTPSQVLGKIKTVDGSNSGLDADLLDGFDSSYFAKAEDLTTVTQEALHGNFNLVKRNGVVQLIIDNWDCATWGTDNPALHNKWRKLFDLDSEYRPVIPVAGGVNNIYCVGLFGNQVRVRVNCDSGEVQAYYTGAETNKFYGSMTWITDE